MAKPLRLGEHKGKRTKNTKTFFNFDGSFTTEVYMGNVHFEDESGDLHDIDLELVDEGKFDSLEKPVSKENKEKVGKVKAKKTREKALHSVGTEFDAKIYRDFSRGYSIGKGKDKLTFIPVGSAKTSAFHDFEKKNRVIHVDAWSETDVELLITDRGIKETIILKTEAAPTSFSFEVKGGLEDDLRAGELKLEPAWLVDANGEKRDVSQTIRKDGNKTYVDLAADVSGLVYPIEIDPTVTIQPDATAGIDTYLNEFSPNSNYPTSALLLVGADSSAQRFRSLIKFDVGGIPQEANITTATLSLKVEYLNYNVVVDVHRVTSAWTESSTWNTMPTFDNSLKASFNGAIGTGDVLNFDIKSMVIEWIKSSNNGVLIKTSTETLNQLIRFHSSDATTVGNRPSLTISYYIPPKPPTITKPGDGEAWNTQHTVEWAPGYGESTVVNQAYDTSGNGGRKLVRLSNGNQYAVVKNGTTDFRIYKSTDNGSSWNLFKTIVSNATDITLVALPNNNLCAVYSLPSNQSITFTTYKDDGTQLNTGNIDINQTTVGNVSLAINEAGTELHAAWASKNATYPNSFNIRYAKYDIATNTWGAVEQLTSQNSVGTDNENPVIVIRHNNLPVILFSNKNSTPSYFMKALRYTGSSWSEIAITSGNSHLKAATTGGFIPQSVNGLTYGRIYCLWHGAATGVTRAVFQSYSDDGGITWSAQEQITDDGYEYPSSAADKDNKLFVVYKGTGTGIYYKVNTAGTWGAQKTIRTDGAGSQPSALFDLSKSYNDPVFIYKDSVASRVGFYGYIALPTEVELSTNNGSTWKNILPITSGTAVNDATVVNSAYQTSASARPQILANGWHVNLLFNANIYYLQVSKNNGVSWEQLATISTGTSYQAGGSITRVGNKVYLTLPWTDRLKFFVVDVPTVANVNLNGTDINLDSSQTALGVTSIIANDTGTELHATWASKNATYPNSFNIRYAKGTINADGSVTWGAVEQRTTLNNASDNCKNPSIIVANGKPVISYEHSIATGLSIKALTYNGTSWQDVTVYSGGSYAQSSPSAIFVPQSVNGLANGRIWVAWQGSDSTEAYNHIRVSYSDDGGVTWSAMQKLTSGNLAQLTPSITANKNNEILIVLEGFISASVTEVRKIKYSNSAWGAVTTVTNIGTNITKVPSALFDLSVNFTEPLFIYKGASKVGFYAGDWTYQAKQTEKGVTSIPYDFTNEPATNQAKIRVRAFDGSYYSNYDEVIFTIVHKTKVGSYGIMTSAGKLLLPIYDPAVGMTGKDALRIKEANMIGCLELVPTTDAKASPLRINTASGIKAIAKE